MPNPFQMNVKQYNILVGCEAKTTFGRDSMESAISLT